MNREIMGGFKTIDPTTEEVLNTYMYMNNEDASKVVENCHNAFLDWRHTSLEDRAKAIKAIGEKLDSHKKEFAALMTREMGKVRKQGIKEIELCVAICKDVAERGKRELKDEERDLPDGGKGIIQYAPIGVIYGIQPWNFPCYQAVRYAIANIMAGNGVLLKHAENCTGSALLLERIIEESGLPKNLFSVLIINEDQSDTVIENRLVRGVTFTGSSATGRHIAQKAGSELKKTVLELGSNDAYLVLEDADIELAVKMSVKGRTYNNGETCIAAKRFIVVSTVYEKFKKGFVEAMAQIKYGNPTDEGTDLGPMAREDLRDKLHEQVAASVERGAKVVLGGEVPEGKGFFYPATVLENVTPGQPAYDEELFGPVASLIMAKNEEDAIRIANDSKFGLGGGIFTVDEQRATDIAKNQMDTGMVFINSFGLSQPTMPFGGVKDSGYGNEHGGFGLKEFVNVKSVLFVEGA